MVALTLFTHFAASTRDALVMYTYACNLTNRFPGPSDLSSGNRLGIAAGWNRAMSTATSRVCPDVGAVPSTADKMSWAPRPPSTGRLQEFESDDYSKNATGSTSPPPTGARSESRVVARVSLCYEFVFRPPAGGKPLQSLRRRNRQPPRGPGRICVQGVWGCGGLPPAPPTPASARKEVSLTAVPH